MTPSRLKRRSLIALGAATLFPLGAHGQIPGKKKRIIRMSIPADDPAANKVAHDAWAKMFASHGLVDGRDVEIEIVRPRTVQLDPNPEYDAIMRKVLDSRPDVILVHISWLHHFARLTRDVPIVFSGTIEPEARGYIDSARRPGRNITGALYPLFELQAKRIGLAKEMMPKARRTAVVCGSGGLQSLIEERIKVTARQLGMEGFVVAVPGFEERGHVTRALREARIDIADFITRVHPDTLPDMLHMGIAGTAGSVDENGDDGILLTYEAVGVDEVAASLAARILKGEKVSTLPAQEPRQFRMTVNLRTARALGVAVPPEFLIRATSVFK